MATPEERFWDWFTLHSRQLYEFEKDQENVFRQLSQQLSSVENGLVFEFGPERNARREFIVSADGNRRRFPAVQRLAAAAPRFEEWIIIPFRPPKDMQSYRSVRINSVDISIDDIWFSHAESDSKIDLEIFVRGLNRANKQEVAGAAFLLLDLALGEYVVETRIGGIDWYPLPISPQADGLLPFASIVEVVKQPLQ